MKKPLLHNSFKNCQHKCEQSVSGHRAAQAAVVYY